MAARKEAVYLSVFLDASKAEKAFESLLEYQGQLKKQQKEMAAEAAKLGIQKEDYEPWQKVTASLKNVSPLVNQIKVSFKSLSKAMKDVGTLTVTEINHLYNAIGKQIDALDGKTDKQSKKNLKKLKQWRYDLEVERDTRGLDKGRGRNLGLAELEKEFEKAPKSIYMLQKYREEFEYFKKVTTDDSKRSVANSRIAQINAMLKEMDVTPMRSLSSILADMGTKFAPKNLSIADMKAYQEQLKQIQLTSKNQADVQAATNAIAELDRRITLSTSSIQNATQAEQAYARAKNILKQGTQAEASSVRELHAQMQQAQKVEGISIETARKYLALEKELAVQMSTVEKIVMTSAQAHQAYNTAKNILAQGENASAAAVRNSIEAMKQAQQAEGISVKQNQLYVATQKQLEQQLNQTATQYMHLRQIRQVVDAGENARVTDINRAIESLKRLSQMEGTTAAQAKEYATKIKLLQDRIKATSSSAEKLAYDEKFIADTLKDVKTTSIENLDKAIRMLDQEIATMNRGNLKKFVEKQQDLKKMKDEMARLKGEVASTNKAFQAQTDYVAKAANKLMNYLGIFGGFYLVRQKVTEAFQANIKYDDSLTNIAKTTQLSAASVEMLADNIKRISTRTSLSEITNLAYAAGRLGVKGVSDVMAFTRAANQINIALGEQLNGAESVEQLMKITALMGQNDELGLEQALLKTGSAINHLTMNSQAVAQPMVDFMRRTAGIATQAGISTSQLTGLAGAVNALGQNVEMSATSISKMIVQMEKHPEAVTKALHMTSEEAKRFKEDLSIGNAMDAFLKVLEKTSELGGLSKLAPIAKQLGSEGQRVIQTIATLSSNYEKVKDMVEMSNKAFSEGVSVTNEYNIKNSNTAALWEKLKNNFSKMTVSTEVIQWLRDFLEELQGMPRAVNQFAKSFSWLGSVVSAVVNIFTEFNFILSGLVKGWMSRIVIGWVVNFATGFWNVWRAIVAATRSLALFKKEAARIGVGNWITLIATAIWGIVDAFTSASRKAKEFRDSLIEGLGRVKDESRASWTEMQGLIDRLKNATKETQEYKDIITEINKKYGTYLDNIFQEAAGWQEVEAALAKVNSELKMKALVEGRSSAMTQVEEDNRTEKSKKEQELIRRISHVSDITDSKDAKAIATQFVINLLAKNYEGKYAMEGYVPARGETKYGEVIPDSSDPYDEFTQKGIDSTVLNRLRVALKANNIISGDEIDESDLKGIVMAMQSLVENLREEEDKKQEASDMYDSDIKVNAKGTFDYYDPRAKERWTAISNNVTQNNQVSSMFDMNEQAVRELKLYWTGIRDAMTKDQRVAERERADKYINMQQYKVDALRNLDIDRNSGSRDKWTKEYREAFDELYMAKEYRRIYNFSETNVEDTSNEDKKAASEAQKEYLNIIQKIKDFYELQTTELRRQRVDREITETAYQRALQQMQINENNALAAARFRIVGDSSAEDWTAAKTQMAGQNIAGVKGAEAMQRIEQTGDVRNIGNLLAKAANTDDTYTISSIRKNADKEILDAAETTRKMTEEVTKAWIEQNPMGKISKQFQEEFEKLDIMLVDLKKRSEMSLEELSDNAMNAYRAVGKEAYKYNISTEKGLKDFRVALVKTGVLMEGALLASDDTIRKVYYKSYEYAEQYEESMKRLTDRTMKMWQKIYEASSAHQGFVEYQHIIESIGKAYTDLEKYGLSKRINLDNNVLVASAAAADAENALNANREKATAHKQSAQALMDNVGKKDKDGKEITAEYAQSEMESADAELAALDAQAEQVVQLYMKVYDAQQVVKESTLEWVGSMEGAFEEFMDGFVPFRSWYEDNGSFASNIFGTKEERQEAFGQFMDDVKKTVRNSIMEYVRMRVSRQVQDKIVTASEKMQAKLRSMFQKKEITETSAIKLAADKTEMVSDQVKTTTEEANSTKATVTEVTNKGTETSATVMGNLAQAVSKCFAQLGPIAGAVAAGVVSAAIGAVLTMAMNALGGSKKTNTSAAAPKTKLVSGMLTYDRGNVQSWGVRTYDGGNTTSYVQGDDGVYYPVQSRDVKPYLLTGMVTRPTLTTIGGAPALVGERGPEMVIGRETTRAMMMSAPDLLRQIVLFDRNRSAGFAKTFDSGNTQTFSAEQIDSMSQDEMKQIILGNQEALAQSASVNAALVAQLNRGIHAVLNVHGTGGALDVISQGFAEERRRGNTQYSKRLLG